MTLAFSSLLSKSNTKLGRGREAKSYDALGSVAFVRQPKVSVFA